MSVYLSRHCIQKMAITVAGELYKPGQSPGQLPFQDLAPGCKQPSPDNDGIRFTVN